MNARSITGQHGHPPATGERYLLFAGTQPPPNGGLGDPLDTFTSEEAARQAFRDVRLRMSSPTSWAQLAVVDDRHGLKPMCWFGIGAEPERDRSAPGRSPVKAGAERSVPQGTTPIPPRPQPVMVACWLLAFVIAIGSTALLKVWATAAVLSCALIIVLVIRVRRTSRAGLRRLRRRTNQSPIRRLEDR